MVTNERFETVNPPCYETVKLHNFLCKNLAFWILFKEPYMHFLLKIYTKGNRLADQRRGLRCNRQDLI